MPESIEKVRHDILRYANCWEDADILLEGLKPEKDNKILSIGSAGDNCFSLLTNSPEVVVAADINTAQLHLISLKKAAIKTLKYDQFVGFLGFTSSDERIDIFNHLRAELSQAAFDYWSGNLTQIENGIINQGKFENYFRLFRQKVLPWIHSHHNIRLLLQEKPLHDQKRVFNDIWNSWRWRTLFKVFFSKTVMGRLGRDPVFLKEVEIPVSQFILTQAAMHLSSVECQSNYFLHMILTGDFGLLMPHYARQENFEQIKANIDHLKIFHGYVQEARDQFGQFHRFNLSNIFEYMDKKTFGLVGQQLISMGEPGARYGYWNLMVPRRMSDQHLSLNFNEDLSEALTKQDKGFFYSRFITETKA